MSTPASPVGITVYDTKFDCPAVFSFFILLIDFQAIFCLSSQAYYSLYLSQTNYYYPMETQFLKVPLNTNIPSLFLMHCVHQ